MSAGATFARHRWFALAVAFLLVNAWGVLKLAAPARFMGRYAVATFEPGPDATVAPQGRIAWEFSEAMVGAEALGAVTGRPPASFVPAVEGRFRWERPHVLAFAPSGGWRPCTRYAAALDGRLRSAAGAPVAPPTSFAFQTEPLRLSKAEQVNFKPEGVAVLQLEFNGAVSPAALAAALALECPAGQRLGARVLGEADSRVMLVETDPVRADTGLLLLAAGLRSVDGPLALPAAVAQPVAFLSALTLVGLEPVSPAFEKGRVLARFSAPLDVASAAAFVEVQPGTDVTVESDWHWEGPRYRITGDFLPGRTYTFTFRRGLKGEQGSALPADAVRQVCFPDRPAALAFRAAGRHLSTQGALAVPLSSLNVPRCSVAVRRVFPNNLVHFALREAGRSGGYYYGEADDGLGGPVATQELAIASRPNEEVETPVRLADLLGGRRAGAYRIEASVPNGPRASHLVVVSDLGLSVERAAGEFLVWANSLRTLEPADGAEVEIWSEANQRLAAGTTGPDGLARLACAPDRPEGAPFVVFVRRGDDATFLALDGSAVPWPGETGGRPYLAAGALEALLYTDRGVYRPGETARVRAVVRGGDLAAPAPFPLELRVLRPDGKTKSERAVPLSAQGTAEYEVPWDAFDPTGTYRLQARVPGALEPLGSASVAVEEFVPPQMKLALSGLPARAAAGAEIGLVARADYLFGAPAGGHPASARVEFLDDEFRPAAPWDGFAFRDAEKSFAPVRAALGQGRTAPDGTASFRARADAAWRPPSALKAVFGATVNETGGRAVSAYATCAVDAYPLYVGLRRADAAAPQTGRPLAFEVAALRPDGAPAADAALQATLARATWSSVLRKEPGGVYRWVSERQLTPVREVALAAAAGRARLEFTPETAGEHVLVVRDPAGGASASARFHVGAPGQEWQPWSMEEPDRLELEFDRPAYRPGEEARLTLRAPFAGRALVTLLADRVIETRTVLLEKNTAELRLPVRDEFRPNVYCAVTLLRPVKAGEPWAAHRAVGVAPLAVDPAPVRLAVAVRAPATIRPAGPLDLEVEVRDAAGAGAPAELTVAAVDEGLCLLTAFATPDPHGFFTARRALGVALHDLYGRLLPEMEDPVARAASAPGGGGPGTDEGGVALRGRLNPVQARRFRPVALWRPAFAAGPDGRASVRFDVPEFSGRLRVMAVAVDGARFGSGEAAVEVRRPLVVQSSLPRFLAPGDVCRLSVDLHNLSPLGGPASVSVAASGPVSVEGGAGGGLAAAATGSVAVAAGGRATLGFDVRAADRAGTATLRLAAALGGETFEEQIELPVRPAAARQLRSGAGVLAAGETATVAWPGGWLPGTERRTLVASAFPGVRLVGGLEYLIRYPYGCIEQTTSAAFPLLYLADLVNAAQPGRMGSGDLDPYLRAAVLRVLSMQTSSGGFAYWPGGSETYEWGSLYATHFLVEAAKAGHAVPEERRRMALDFAASLLARPPRAAGDAGGAEWRADRTLRAHACLVLAAAGRPDRGWMARLGEQLDTAGGATRLYLSAALAAAGQRRDASALLRDWAPAAGATPRERDGQLHSPSRSDALLLSAWMDLDPANPIVPSLAKRLEEARRDGAWPTTQENAFALMALGKYCRWLAREARPFAATAAWDGGAQRRAFDSRREFRFESEEPGGGPVTLANEGPGTLHFAWTAEGVPLSGEVEEADRRMRVRRRLFDETGREVAPGALAQGRLYVVEWQIEADDAPAENVVVEDLLPAGLEIENENLRTSEFLPWARERTTLPVRFVDRRDDRLVAFASTFSGRQTYAYAVRAVAPGRFAGPAVTASCMYAPELRSVHGRTMVVVEAAK